MNDGLTGQTRLRATLTIAQDRGFIGPGDLEPHVDHALAFARALGPVVPAAVVDLGSGGGLPGLVLALHWPDSRWVLLDASDRRTAFLREAVDLLDLAGRVQVVRGRAESVAHEAEWRGSFDLVAVRAFGPPGVVAECAAGFLRVGGYLAVSEPPEKDPSRWDATDVLGDLGLEVTVEAGEGENIQILRQIRRCPERYPRRVGIPVKRPLF